MVKKTAQPGNEVLSAEERMAHQRRHVGLLRADKDKGEYVRRTEVGFFALGYTGAALVARDLMSDSDTIIGSEVICEYTDDVTHKTETHMDGFKESYDGEAIVYLDELNDLPLVKGVVAIVGGHGSGKTPFMRDTLYPAIPAEQAEYLTFGEPWHNYGSRGCKLAEQVLSALAAGNKTILIDSLKNVMDRTSGPLAKEGINRPFFSMLSDWSSTAMRMNCTIVVVVNLLSDTPAVIAENLNRLNSSTNMVILAEGGGQFSYKVRDHDESRRISGTFTSDENKFSHGGVRTGGKAFTDSEYRTRLQVVQKALLEQQMLQII